MPELPEVETIVRDLDKKLKNKKIANIKILDKKIFKITKPREKIIFGRTIKAVRRRAKMLIFDLGGRYLIIHLKMTGQLVYQSGGKLIAGGHPIAREGKVLPNQFTRVIFTFSGGGTLYFNDVRRFGWIKLFNQDEYARLESGQGIEPLSPAFSLDFFKNFLSLKSKATIKQALMDQRYLSGLGNIYADESLFAARIKPFRRVGSLKPAEINKLWRAIPKILKYAVRHRGTSFNDYVDARGEVGNFIKYLKVYGRAGQKCKGCAGVVSKTKLGGRGTHWCDLCQK